jgi:LmbE family N-acetylglucosaminyl deacetylase
MPVPSLLAVFAHPDDESLSAGGVLARHAAAGARTAVVTATWAADTPRAAELAEALRILGAGKPRMLGYADARVPQSAPGCVRFCDAPLDEAVRRLVAHIRELRPDIMVTHDAYGGLPGHPDHVHTHRVTMRPAKAAGLELLYPDAGSSGCSTQGAGTSSSRPTASGTGWSVSGVPMSSEWRRRSRTWRLWRVSARCGACRPRLKPSMISISPAVGPDRESRRRACSRISRLRITSV